MSSFEGPLKDVLRCTVIIVIEEGGTCRFTEIWEAAHKSVSEKWGPKLLTPVVRDACRIGFPFRFFAFDRRIISAVSIPRASKQAFLVIFVISNSSTLSLRVLVDLSYKWGWLWFIISLAICRLTNRRGRWVWSRWEWRKRGYSMSQKDVFVEWQVMCSQLR